MRAYSASSEEALLARNQLKDWSGEAFLTPAQYQAMEQETVCDLRRTNVFLRLVLFFFSLVILAAGLGLFFTIFVSRSNQQVIGTFLLIFAPVSYAAAEFAVSKAKLYRFGIEEALLACAVGFLCVGLELAIFNGSFSSHAGEFLVPACAIAAALWIWHRFGLAYAFLAAMIFVVWLTWDLTSSHVAQHVIIAVFYVVGLLPVAALGAAGRLTHLQAHYSIAEALLWLGIYLAINLELSSVDQLDRWWNLLPAQSEFPPPFYWATWVLTWCVPPIVLIRGIRTKDRYVMAVGAIITVLTLATNKPYLGWPRHTWDPMLLGILLSGVALYVRRWLSRGAEGIRQGFTARRMSGKDKQLMGVASTAFGLAAPHATAPPPAPSHEPQFGGGDSGGGGASSDY